MKRIYLYGMVMALAMVLCLGGIAQAANLVVNGSFENPTYLTNNGDTRNNPSTATKWNAFPADINDTFGWNVQWNFPGDIPDVSVATDPPVKVKDRPLLELQSNGCVTSSTVADDGVQWAELDSDWTGPFTGGTGGAYQNGEKSSVTIYQNLNTLPGDYELSFAFGGRPNTIAGQNVLEVQWNGDPIAGSDFNKANPGSAINWETITRTVTAIGTETELSFTDKGDPNDSLGTYLDSVVVTRVGTGCTYTQGYWKTHSEYGPASYNDTWAQVGEEGEDSDFFLSGKDWYEIMNTPPKKGDAYIILAHQYIAAYLNLANNAADAPGLQEKMAEAETFFQTHVYEGPLAKNDPDRETILNLADFLASYNEGTLEGSPGHCF